MARTGHDPYMVVNSGRMDHGPCLVVEVDLEVHDDDEVLIHREVRVGLVARDGDEVLIHREVRVGLVARDGEEVLIHREVRVDLVAHGEVLTSRVGLVAQEGGEVLMHREVRVGHEKLDDDSNWVVVVRGHVRVEKRMPVLMMVVVVVAEHKDQEVVVLVDKDFYKPLFCCLYEAS